MSPLRAELLHAVTATAESMEEAQKAFDQAAREHREAIFAAADSDWPRTSIALAAGVTRQRIDQILARRGDVALEGVRPAMPGA